MFVLHPLGNKILEMFLLKLELQAPVIRGRTIKGELTSEVSFFIQLSLLGTIIMSTEATVLFFFLTLLH